MTLHFKEDMKAGRRIVEFQVDNKICIYAFLKLLL